MKTCSKCGVVIASLEAELEAANANRCDDCGADLIDNCMVCMAPVCCPQCCRVDALKRLHDAAKAELEAALAALANCPRCSKTTPGEGYIRASFGSPMRILSKYFAVVFVLLSLNVSAWDLVYSNDHQGNTTSGYKSSLVADVLDAKDIKVQVEAPLGTTKTFRCVTTHYHEASGQIWCEAHTLSANVRDTSAGVSFWRWEGNLIFSTDGTELYWLKSSGGSWVSGRPALPMNWFSQD